MVENNENLENEIKDDEQNIANEDVKETTEKEDVEETSKAY